ncbi:MAG: serine protease [Cytophagales bacterium]|nr:serine protease [Bernardetiaceae bacterium]MDW8204771.1 serine protease [Cytophagales bacterium]
MKTDEQFLVWSKIERYVEGDMEAGEYLAFEKELAENPILAQQVADYQQIRNYLDELKERRLLRTKLDQFHAAIDPIEQQAALKVYKNRQIWRHYVSKYLPTIAIAASVALITVLSTLFTLGYLRNMERSQQSSLKLLRRELDQIKRDIKNSKDTLSRFAPRTMTAPQRFEGTCFAISEKGHLITSYHLVAKADSVFIESTTQPGLRYKVELAFGDERTDLAVLKITDSTFRSFGKIPYTLKKGTVDLGEEVFTLAYPKNDIVYGEGSISARTGFEGDSIAYQISIPVNPGNSGSPVFDDSGNIIGVVSGKLSGAEGVAFALKSSTVWRTLKDSLPEQLDELFDLPKQSKLAGQKRTAQLKKMQDFIFQVKVY